MQTSFCGDSNVQMSHSLTLFILWWLASVMNSLEHETILVLQPSIKG